MRTERGHEEEEEQSQFVPCSLLSSSQQETSSNSLTHALDVLVPETLHGSAGECGHAHYVPCSLTCSQAREASMAKLDAEEEVRQETGSLVQLEEQIEEETQDVRLQQEPAVMFVRICAYLTAKTRRHWMRDYSWSLL